MAAFVRCGACKGNMWPTGQLKEHTHFDPETNKWPLKLKLRTRGTGWSKAASPRTNSPKAVLKTVGPRKRAYGPF